MTERDIQNIVTLNMSKAGGIFWRNNVGALLDSRGVPVRYGLANESKAMNRKIKSSDLIGILPVAIKPHHVGLTFGLFCARECKSSGWKFSPSGREVPQLNFINIVNSMGGNAAFVNYGEEFYNCCQ